jgi:hypothetical protein
LLPSFHSSILFRPCQIVTSPICLGSTCLASFSCPQRCPLRTLPRRHLIQATRFSLLVASEQGTKKGTREAYNIPALFGRHWSLPWWNIINSAVPPQTLPGTLSTLRPRRHPDQDQNQDPDPDPDTQEPATTAPNPHIRRSVAAPPSAYLTYQSGHHHPQPTHQHLSISALVLPEVLHLSSPPSCPSTLRSFPPKII